MCSIVGSFNKETIKKLIKENTYRGNFSFSITSVNPETYQSTTHREFGDFDEGLLDSIFKEGLYYLCHTQAPTGGLERDLTRVHPIKMDGHKLLHNGIIKQKWVNKQKKIFGNDDNFDTRQLLYHISKYLDDEIELTKALKGVDGSFACALINENKSIKIFSNDSSVIHFNGTDLSSHEVDGFTKLTPYKVFDLDLRNKTIIEEGEFESINMPFFFA